ncbi:MAG: hypothetical protein ACYDH5_18500 [Acidimicrobiales bacterium]
MLVVAAWEAYRLGEHSAVWPSLVSFLLLAPAMLFGLIARGGIGRERWRVSP